MRRLIRSFLHGVSEFCGLKGVQRRVVRMMNPVGDFLQIARICNESSLPEYRVLWYYECAKDRVTRDLMENRLTLRA